MDLLVFLVALVSLVLVWSAINKRMKSNSGTFKRHLLGGVGGVFSFFLIVSIALSIGMIDSEQADVATAQQENAKETLSFKDMMNERNDYTEESGELVVNSEKPLSFTIYAEDMVNQTDEYKMQNVQRAVLYGVYRTFVHTEEPSVDATAYALDIESLNPRQVVVNESIKVQVSVTREEALKAVQSLLPNVESFQDLVRTHEVGGMEFDDQWTEKFDQFYWEADGQKKLIDALKSQG